MFPLCVLPLRWFFCLLGGGSFHSVLCIPPYFGCFGFFMIGRVSSSLSLMGANESLFVYTRGFSPNVSSVMGLKCRSTYVLLHFFFHCLPLASFFQNTLSDAKTHLGCVMDITECSVAYITHPKCA